MSSTPFPNLSPNIQPNPFPNSLPGPRPPFRGGGEDPASFPLPRPSVTGIGRPLKSEPPLVQGELRQLYGAARVVLAQALAESTWRGHHSVFRRYLQFANHLEASQLHLEPEVMLVLFITRLLKRGDIDVSSALTYVNSLVSCLRRHGVELKEKSLIKDIRRALRRMGASKPKRQAPPATLAEVHKAIRDAPTAGLKLIILLSWRAGARVGDVARLRRQDLVLVPGGAKLGFWDAKNDPFHLGCHTGVTLSQDESQLLETFWGRTEEIHPLARYACQVDGHLKTVNPILSRHSLRRGALTALLRSGVDLDSIRGFSKHSSISALLRYLPAAEIPSVSKATELSKFLLDTC